MIAIEISSFGGPAVLTPVERAKPRPQPGEILVRVEAAGVSRADVMQRMGKYPPPAGTSDIPGLDLAGVVEESNGKQWKPGDRVCAIVAGGGYAEFCALPAIQALPIPDGWTSAEAATLPENLFTVYDNLVTRAAMQPGETVLIHGGTSGIGSSAIMLSRLVGAVPIATAGTKAKCDACLRFGAKLAINYKESDFVSEVKRFTDGRGVDLIADIVGGAYLARNLDALATEGRISLISMQEGRTAELDLGRLMIKRGRIIGSTMRARTPEQKGAVAGALLRNIWPLLPAKDKFRPIIDSKFPLREAARAHARIEGGEHIGKIILTV